MRLELSGHMRNTTRDHTRAPVGHGPASSSILAGLDSIPPSFGDHRNHDERIWSSIRLTPNLLACARLFSGRALLAMNNLARFVRPTFDPCAFLLEHVCDSSQATICVTPREITPALATLTER